MYLNDFRCGIYEVVSRPQNNNIQYATCNSNSVLFAGKTKNKRSL